MKGSWFVAALVFVAAPALAQEPVPAPPPAPPAEAPPAPAPAPPPPPTPPPPPAAAPPAVEAPTRERPGLGLEVATAGFASGNLLGGLVMGIDFPEGALFGLRIDYRRDSRTVAGRSTSQRSLSVGLAGRLPVLGSREGVQLAIALDAAYLKTQLPGPNAFTEETVDAAGYAVAIGPHLRYWIRPQLAIGYLAQVTYAKARSEDAPQDPFGGPPPDPQVTQTHTSVEGAFTLTGSF